MWEKYGEKIISKTGLPGDARTTSYELLRAPMSLVMPSRKPLGNIETLFGGPSPSLMVISMDPDDLKKRRKKSSLSKRRTYNVVGRVGL